VKFEWTQECEEGFLHLKEFLKSTLILNIVDPNEDFVVCIYGCKEGLGRVLRHNGHVICYKSRKIKDHERNYATHYLCLESIIHVLKMWRNYLVGRKFELMTDHNGLEYLFEESTLNAR
jgi:hypothetical protein